MTRRALGIASVALACLGCAGPEGGGDAASEASSGPLAGPDADRLRIVLVTHGQAADPFWSIVHRGAEEAADQVGVDLETQAPTRFDMVAMSQLIEAATASAPDGLVVSIPDGDALAPAVRAAVERGIPVVSINSGEAASARLGALVHVGQPEYEAGLGAGERLVATGARRALCVNHEVGNSALDERCRGLADAFSGAGGSAVVLAVDLASPDDAEQRVRSALSRDTGADALLILGPALVAPVLRAVGAAASAPSGRGAASSSLRVATFDLGVEVLDALEDGRLLFAVDQQPYLQGYLPVVMLATYRRTLALPGGGQVMRTGPGFVTAETAARVRALSRAGLR